MSDHDITSEDKETFKIRTKPCWICGQHSYVTVPTDAWRRFDLYNVHLEDAWPSGSAEDKQLIRTGVHPKCWDEEFPDDSPKENN